MVIVCLSSSCHGWLSSSSSSSSTTRTKRVGRPSSFVPLMAPGKDPSISISTRTRRNHVLHQNWHLTRTRSPTTSSSTTGSSSPTSLGMFDWFNNPTNHKKKGSGEPENNDNDDATATNDDNNETITQPQDFLSNFFQSLTSSSASSSPSRHSGDDNLRAVANHPISKEMMTMKADVESRLEASSSSTTSKSTSTTVEADIVATQQKDDVVVVEHLVKDIDKKPTTEKGDRNRIHRGKVLWFSTKKGYGFIEMDETTTSVATEDVGTNNEDATATTIFVHFSDISIPEGNDDDGSSSKPYFGKLLANEPVEFQIQEEEGFDGMTQDGNDPAGEPNEVGPRQRPRRTKAIHVTGPDGTPVLAIRRQQDRHRRRSLEQTGSKVVDKN